MAIRPACRLALAFFRDKVRNPFPRKLDIVEFDAFSVHNYWLEILSGTPGRSTLEAHVKPDNTIEIQSHDIKTIRLYLRKELLPKPGDLKIVWNGKKLFSGPVRDYCSAPELPLTIIRDANGKVDPSDIRDLTLP
jgi:hypothetical protein